MLITQDSNPALYVLKERQLPAVPLRITTRPLIAKCASLDTANPALLTTTVRPAPPASTGLVPRQGLALIAPLATPLQKWVLLLLQAALYVPLDTEDL